MVKKSYCIAQVGGTQTYLEIVRHCRQEAKLAEARADLKEWRNQHGGGAHFVLVRVEVIKDLKAKRRGSEEGNAK